LAKSRSAPVSERFFTFLPLTAFFLICFAPTLFLGRLIAA
jgi:hypothetical protein